MGGRDARAHDGPRRSGWIGQRLRERTADPRTDHGMAGLHDSRGPMMADFSLESVARFLNQEGRLLDQRKFQGWLGLFEDDAIYWIPLQRGQTDARAVPSIVYED